MDPEWRSTHAGHCPIRPVVDRRPGMLGLSALRRSRPLAIAAGVFGALFLGSVVLLVLRVARM